MRERDGEYLFSQGSIQALFEAVLKKMRDEIDQLGADHLLTTNIEDWCDHLESQYKIAPIRIKREDVSAEQKTAKLDVSQDLQRPFVDRSKPCLVEGTAITFFVPFEGDPSLFKFHSSTISFNPPFAKVGQGELLFSYTLTGHDVEPIKAEFNGQLNHAVQLAQRMEEEVEAFNKTVRGQARNHLEWRKNKLLKDRGMMKQLGVPLRRREGVPATYSVPVERKVIRVRPPAYRGQPFVPEPALELEVYEDILNIISNMVAVMERSPAAFAKMKEEDLRQHFLVQLNGQFNGQATGETFNYEGKTDILIRHQGKNIFIAECKFWRGPSSIRGALDQLLGYLSWKDTKAAILLFNRRKELTALLQQIPYLVESHPCFKKSLAQVSETSFRFIFGHNDDSNREIILTVMVFDVPQ